ncbi:MAG: RDD family protein [Candidatus Eiseniibacteriota bacterium]
MERGPSPWRRERPSKPPPGATSRPPIAGPETERGVGRRRLLAGALDSLIGIALAAVLAPSTGTWFLDRSVPTFHVGEPGTLWTGPIPMVMALAGRLVYGFPFAVLVVLLAGPLFGSTPGQRLAGLRVVGNDGRPAGRGPRAFRFALATLPLSLAVLGLAVARWELIVAAVAAATFAFGWYVVAKVRGVDRAWHDVPTATYLARDGASSRLRRPSR